MKIALSICILMFVFAGSASAALITYVDAAGSNTVSVVTQASLSESSVTSATRGTDNLWAKRTDSYTSNATIYEASGDENCQRLVTSVTGLTGGTYNVYAYFWAKPASTSELWVLRTGLADTAAELPLYGSLADASNSCTAATTAVASNFANLSPVSSGGISLMQVSLGTVTVTKGVLSVFVDDYSGLGLNQRTWYDGIGYSAVTATAAPEPSTIALLGLVGLVLAVRARRQ